MVDLSSGTMQMDEYGTFIHDSFTKLQLKQGSGYYFFTERIGLGGIFYLNSIGAIPYNPPQIRAAAKHHDEYDVLRAVEHGAIQKLHRGDEVQFLRYGEAESADLDQVAFIIWKELYANGYSGVSWEEFKKGESYSYVQAKTAIFRTAERIIKAGFKSDLFEQGETDGSNH